MDLRRHGDQLQFNLAEFEHDQGEDKVDDADVFVEEVDNVKEIKSPNNILAKKFSKCTSSGISCASNFSFIYEGNSMVPRGMFENSELRENLLKLQDIAFDGFRERIQKKGSHLKTSFLRHISGLSLWRDFQP